MRYIYEFWQGITESMVPLALVLSWMSLFLVFYAVACAIRTVLARRKRKRTERIERAEMERRLQYALPQRENAYIRARLQTSLRVEGAEESRQAHVRLGYARALLGKVRGAPLTVAERLQTEEMGKELALYRGKEIWTAEELRGLNDLCAVLLKLSAKYAV